MIIENVDKIRDYFSEFVKYDCIVIIRRFNGGKSSIITDMIHEYFRDDNTYYATFTEQSKPNFVARKSKLEFGELVKNKIIIFDEINDDLKRDVESYVKSLMKNNKVIILTNPYSSSNDAEKEIALFQKHEKDILPTNTLFIFIRD